MSAIHKILKAHKTTYEKLSLGQQMLVDSLMPYANDETLDEFLKPFLKSGELAKKDFNAMTKLDKIAYLREKRLE